MFYCSGWTQEELAKVEGGTRQNMAYRMRFGRFLQFATAVAIPRNLTSRRFQDYWDSIDQNEKNECIRFLAVQKLIEAETKVSKSTLPKKEPSTGIIKKFADGEWHKLAAIRAHANAPEENVAAVLDGMCVEALAVPFFRRDWSQDELANMEGITQTTAGRWPRFEQFWLLLPVTAIREIHLNGASPPQGLAGSHIDAIEASDYPWYFVDSNRNLVSYYPPTSNKLLVYT